MGETKKRLPGLPAFFPFLVPYAGVQAILIGSEYYHVNELMFFNPLRENSKGQCTSYRENEEHQA